MVKLPKYSIGVGDRFGRQGPAQLAAVQRAADQGVEIAPVWNKSHREHTIVGTRPEAVRAEADAAVASAGYTGPYFVDADHISSGNVNAFLKASDFFTLDVAEAIGRPAPPEQVDAFLKRHPECLGRLEIPGIAEPLEIDEPTARAVAGVYLEAAAEAGRLYRHIEAAKDADAFVTEVSMDETDRPQTPVELLLILAALADEGIPAQTIAPRFSGRFNKGVDYVGDPDQFAVEFEQDLAVIAWAVGRFGLPENLKLSVHSGSDKFSIYGPIREAITRFDTGLHLKTAGTTWLEELIGLASAGGDGLAMAKQIYAEALDRFDELCGPYATVIDIDPALLPTPEVVDGWDADTFASALRHDPACPAYNPHLRQLLHVAYKVAAMLGPRYLDALARHADVVAQNVTENLYARHIHRLFIP
ncbi:MAG: hypothetical protein JW818_18670 [Pirellulales bacterium]|nr:hypothetical protein [Pirellulales bacterium]